MSTDTSVARALRPGHAPAPRRGRGRDRSEPRAFWILGAPFVIGLAVFGIVPIIWSVVISFGDARATLVPDAFVGFDNYLALFGDPAFTQSLASFALFAVFIVPVTLGSSLGLALLVHNLPFAQAFFRSVFFLPTAFSYVIASLIWKLGIFSGQDSGAANAFLDLFGFDAVNQWLTKFPYLWVVLISVRLWLQVGFYMILFIAGLQRIPPSLYEAAALDGLEAGPRRFFWITLPQLRPTITAVLLLLLVAAFQSFDEFFNLAGNPATRPPLVYLYNVSFSQLDYGKGAAGSLILTVIMVVVALLQNRILGFGDSGRVRRSPRKAKRQ